MTALTTLRGQALRRFARHYLEMVVGMGTGVRQRHPDRVAGEVVHVHPDRLPDRFPLPAGVAEVPRYIRAL